MIEEEMKHEVEDHPLGSYLTVDAVASIKEMTLNQSPEEVPNSTLSLGQRKP